MWRKQRSMESKGGKGEEARVILQCKIRPMGSDGGRAEESQGQRLAPSDEDELVGRRPRLGVDLDVEHGVAAVTVGEISAEGLEILGLLALLLNLDELLVIGDLEDQVLQWGVWGCMGAYGMCERALITRNRQVGLLQRLSQPSRLLPCTRCGSSSYRTPRGIRACTELRMTVKLRGGVGRTGHGNR